MVVDPLSLYGIVEAISREGWGTGPAIEQNVVGRNLEMSTAPPVDVRITRAFSAPPERVFDAWLDPKLIGQWMFGPRLQDEEVLHVEVDPRVQGSFSFLVRRQGKEIDHLGRYLGIDRPRKLVFTWGIAGHSVDKSVVSVVIVPSATGCVLTLTHQLDPAWAAYATGTEAGWTKMLDALAATLDEA
jgi:uncharacterized protein YndB with AHSA1/START domain